MQEDRISAEITPVSGKANEAALALQRLGFRVMHIGVTISVEGPEELWGTVFNVSFVLQQKEILPEIEGGIATYRKAVTDNLEIPVDLRSLVSNVAFVEPPELY